MMSAEEMRSLNPGDRVSWGPQLPMKGWVIVTNHIGILCGWDNGELTSWRWDETQIMLRAGEHMSLVRRGNAA